MDSSIIELILASGILIWGIYDFWLRKDFIQRFSSINLAFWMSALFFGLGPWAALYYGRGKLETFDIKSLSLAYIGVLFYLGGLSFSRKFLPSKIKNHSKFLNRENCFKVLGDSVGLIHPEKTLLVYAFVLLVRCYSAFHFGILLDQVNDERIKDLPYVVVTVRALADILDLGCVLWSCLFFWKYPLKRKVPILLLVSEFFFSIFQGRRQMLFLFIILGLGFYFSSFKPRRKYTVALLVIFFTLNIFLFPFFVQMRSSHISSNANNAAAEIEDTFLELQSESQEIKNIYSENMAKRPLIIRFNCQILQQEEIYGWMMGQAFLSTFIWIIPSAIFPQKHEMLQPEQSVENHFGLPMIDTSSNWPAYGCADFGLLGGWAAGLLIGLVLSLLERISFWFLKHSTFLALCSMQAALALSMCVEAEPTLAWTYLRSLFLFALLYKIILIFRVRKQSSHLVLAK